MIFKLSFWFFLTLSLSFGLSQETSTVIQFGTAQNDSFIDSAFDTEGNLFVVGTLGLLRDEDSSRAVIRKYDTELNLVWESVLNSDAQDVATHVVFSEEYGLFVSGYTTGSLGEQVGEADLFVAKLEPLSGDVLWLKQFGSSGLDFPKGFVLGAEGDLFLSGQTEGDFGGLSQGDFDAFVVRLSLTGDVLWVEQFGSLGFDSGLALALSRDLLFVVSRDNRFAQPRSILSGFGFEGELLFSAELGEVDFHADLLFVAEQGTLFIATKRHQCSHMNCRTAKSVIDFYAFKDEVMPLDSLWLSDWINRIAVYPVALSQDNAGNVYLASSTLLSDSQDVFINKYSPEGKLLASDSFGTGAGESLDSLSISSAGKIVLTGTTAGSFQGENAGNGDAFILLLGD